MNAIDPTISAKVNSEQLEQSKIDLQVVKLLRRLDPNEQIWDNLLNTRILTFSNEEFEEQVSREANDFIDLEFAEMAAARDEELTRFVNKSKAVAMAEVPTSKLDKDQVSCLEFERRKSVVTVQSLEKAILDSDCSNLREGIIKLRTLLSMMIEYDVDGFVDNRILKWMASIICDIEEIEFGDADDPVT